MFILVGGPVYKHRAFHTSFNALKTLSLWILLQTFWLCITVTNHGPIQIIYLVQTVSETKHDRSVCSDYWLAQCILVHMCLFRLDYRHASQVCFTEWIIHCVKCYEWLTGVALTIVPSLRTDFFDDMSGQISSRWRQLSTKQWSGNKCGDVPTKIKTLSYAMDHRDWPGKQRLAEHQACCCTRLQCFSQIVKPFWRLILSL